jgi:hypothetical protein
MATNLTTTTTTALVSGGPQAQSTVALTSVTGIVAASTGVNTMLLIDSELMTVESVNTVTLVCTVQRGQGGTKVANHGSGANVWFGAPQYFAQFGPPGFPSTQGRFRYFTTPSIQTSLTGLGHATTDTAGGLFIADVTVGKLMISTGGAVLNGVTVGTDTNAVYLYDYSGALIASSVTAITAGASAFQSRAWAQPTVLPAGQYFLAYQTNGTTDTFQTIVAATWIETVTETLTGTAGSPPANLSTIPTSFTDNVGVIGFVY